ncbi:MAG TPA: glycosyltransferase [Pedobacter sp.]|nr:glycosyltransferase [Pedobacter sp.]
MKRHGRNLSYENLNESMLVSVCIPCYNSGQYLAETLNCLINQTYQNLEIIIIDDHSTDQSVKIIQAFVQKDRRINFEIAKNKGAAAARNQAYSLSKGRYIIFFDADDFIEENFIATQLKCLQSDQEVVVSTWGRFYHNDLSTIVIDSSQMEMDLTFEDWISNYWGNSSNMTCPGRVLIARNLLEKSGLWDEELSLNDDFPFYTRIFSNSSLIRYNTNSLFYYRSGINGLSALKSESGYNSLYLSLMKGIKVAEEKFPNNKKIQLACANLLQNFIYEIYPSQPKLRANALTKIKTLGGSDFEFPAGGKTKSLAAVIGWKLAKRLKIIFNKP